MMIPGCPSPERQQTTPLDIGTSMTFRVIFGLGGYGHLLQCPIRSVETGESAFLK